MKSGCVGRRVSDFHRIDECEQGETMPCLVVFAFGLGWFRRVFQPSFQIIFWNSLDFCRTAWEAVRQKPVAVEESQHLPICQKPRFHCLHHWKDLVAVERWKSPPVSRLQVLDSSDGCCWPFGIDQKCTDFSRIACMNCSPEPVECLVSVAAGNNSGPRFTGSGFCAVRCKTLSASRNRVFVVPAAFDIDSDRHQRFPPISPLVQSLPSEYLSSQTSNPFPSSR